MIMLPSSNRGFEKYRCTATKILEAMAYFVPMLIRHSPGLTQNDGGASQDHLMKHVEGGAFDISCLIRVIGRVGRMHAHMYHNDVSAEL